MDLLTATEQSSPVSLPRRVITITNKEKIEQAAVLAIQNAFLPLEKVTARLDTQDKVPCIDGWIEVRNSPRQNKANIVGRIDVQIKGTTSKPSSDNHCSKSVEISDLKHYRNVCYGALYFVVCMRSDYTLRSIYYAQLLPFDIDQILKTTRPDQKTVKVKFKPLPKDVKKLDRLCSEFIEDKKRQSGDVVIGFKTIDEWRSQGFSTERCLVLSKGIADPSELASLDVWENGGYWYMQTAEGALHAIEKIEVPDVVEVGAETEFESDGYRASMLLMQGESREGRFFYFGSFEINLGRSPSFRYTPKGSIPELYRDAQLARGICKSGVLKMGSLVLTGISFEKLSVEEVEEQVRVLGKYCSLLDILKIKTPIVLDDLSDSDMKQLGKLGAAFVDGMPQEIPNTDEQLVSLNMDLSIGRIKVIGRANADGKYDFWNPLGSDTVCLLVKDYLDSPDEYMPLPSSFILTHEDFKEVVNLDAATFQSSLDEVPICDGNREGSSSKLLEMIDAYDEGAKCAADLIECCIIIADAILSTEPDNQYSQLNLLQVIVRKRKLNEVEKSQLQKIIVSPIDRRALAAAYIVRGDSDLAKEVLSQLPEDELEDFKRWPIHNLLKPA